MVDNCGIMIRKFLTALKDSYQKLQGLPTLMKEVYICRWMEGTNVQCASISFQHMYRCLVNLGSYNVYSTKGIGRRDVPLVHQ